MLVASTLSAVALAGGGAAGPAVASPTHASSAVNLAARYSCTLTSSHTCIRGGQFCPQASYGRSGWDAAGRRYVCKGDRRHPHWMKP
jgi:hypothetical protein